MTKKPALVALATAGMLTVAGCTATGDEPSAEPPRLEHIHALIEDPDTDGLLIASHTGIYGLSMSGDIDGPIGGHEFDAMGFALTDDAFLASGHPGPETPAELGSPNLGIIRSDDAGQTWSPVSLNGEEDFHVLTTGPDGTVYGVGSTRPDLLISTDQGRTWATGATVPMAALAVTETGLYAATEAGLQHSSDNGQSFSPLDDAPLLYALAVGDGVLAGVSPDGMIWTKDTTGVWTEQGTTEGRVEALELLEDGTIVLVDDRGVVRVTESGTELLLPKR